MMWVITELQLPTITSSLRLSVSLFCLTSVFMASSSKEEPNGGGAAFPLFHQRPSPPPGGSFSCQPSSLRGLFVIFFPRFRVLDLVFFLFLELDFFFSCPLQLHPSPWLPRRCRRQVETMNRAAITRKHHKEMITISFIQQQNVCINLF